LLDDNESRFLDSFFDGVSSDHFDYNLFTNPPGEAEAGFGWDELPPTFMGTTSSFGQQPQMGAQDVPNMTFNGLPSQLHTNHPPIPPSTSADVLEAATLLQNGSAGRSHSVADGALYQAPDMNLQPPNGRVRHQSLSQFPPSRSYGGNHQRQSSDDFMRDTFYTSMVFGNPTETTVRQRNVHQKMDIRWGSDASFGTPQGFLAPGHQHADAEVERAQINSLESAFKLDSEDGTHADNSHATSPISAFRPPRRTKSDTQLDDEAEDSRPRKRRKSKFQDEVDEDDDVSNPHLPGLKKRKSTSKKDKEPADSEPGHKRRKSTAASAAAAAAAAAGKALRENLTEDQKRENHIRSEQKRRTLIREGFEDLGELVPGLRGGGFSKSAVLIMAADWLEDLLQGNETLKTKLNEMEGR
jgi:hypothetical protein